jgi:prepilin-type N-terminal cleavage/methylation domain-containing protein
MIAIRRLVNDETGMTLPELMVSLIILGIVSTMVMSGAIAIFRSSRVQNQDYDTLGALRNAVGFMERELREGRRMYASSTSQDLTIWVDHDRDLVEEDDDVIRYLISDEDGDGTYELRRTTNAGTTQILARYLTPTSHFEYRDDVSDLGYDNPAVTNTSVIVIELTADSPGTAGPARNVETQVRLRNVELD